MGEHHRISVRVPKEGAAQLPQSGGSNGWNLWFAPLLYRDTSVTVLLPISFPRSKCTAPHSCQGSPSKFKGRLLSTRTT